MQREDYWVIEFFDPAGATRVIDVFLNSFAADDYADVWAGPGTLLSAEHRPDSPALLRGLVQPSRGALRDHEAERWAELVAAEAEVGRQTSLGALACLIHEGLLVGSSSAFSHRQRSAGAGLVLSPPQTELNVFDKWDEETILQRGAALFEVARKIWRGPMDRAEAVELASSKQ